MTEVVRNPTAVYRVLGPPVRATPVVEPVELDSPLGLAIQAAHHPVGRVTQIEIAYWPGESHDPIELSEWPNSHVYHLLGERCGTIRDIDTTTLTHKTNFGPTVIAHVGLDDLVAPHLTPNLADLIMVRDHLDSAMCEAIIASLDESTGQYGQVLTDAGENKTRLDQKARVVFTMRSRKAAMVKQVLRDLVIDLVEPFFNTTIEFWNQPVLLHYETGGFFIPHVDGEMYRQGEWIRIYDRDYTLVAFLNEDYEGGDLVFPGLNFRVTPKRGRVVAFPGSHIFQHGAERITRGDRYQLVSWLTAEGTPRTNTPPNPTVIYRDGADSK